MDVLRCALHITVLKKMKTQNFHCELCVGPSNKLRNTICHNSHWLFCFMVNNTCSYYILSRCVAGLVHFFVFVFFRTQRTNWWKITGWINPSLANWHDIAGGCLVIIWNVCACFLPSWILCDISPISDLDTLSWELLLTWAVSSFHSWKCVYYLL